KFDAGARLLFYATYEPKSKTWEVYGCNRGSNLEGAADDLLYLRALPLSAGRNRVSGTLAHYEDGPDKSFSLVERVAGAKVSIKGKDKTYEVTTNADGVYELYDLPPGEYTIEPELPFGLKVRFPMHFGPAGKGPGVTVKLTEKTSAGSDFVLNSDNSIGGRVLAPGGVPMQDVCVELFTASKAEGEGDGRIFDCTDAEGRYKLEDVPPGKYLIAANDDGRLSGAEPFPVVFYPGTFEREKASVVTVGRGDRRADYDLAVPSLRPTVTVSGVLLYSDGHPAADLSVTFETGQADARYERAAYATTDDAGRFTLTLLKGVPGKLYADFRVYEGKFEQTCPEMKKLIEKGADKLGAATLLTNSAAVEADRDAPDVRLVFPAPFCPLNKRDDDN
ncbi:MAG TPA: hypothetical protein VKB12_00460, partial [Pyrinomonadaceae bacterium]|nr:hypothetical protein [Pyrinomonadaceae bacterium]